MEGLLKMADFWIKIEKGTPDKPEVLEMSAILNIDDPDTVMGKLIRVWSWFDSNSENGHAPTVTKKLLNRLTGVEGFVESMVVVGWLAEKEDGFYMTNHDRHLGKSAKKRALDAERQRKSRTNRDKNVTREEKRREEKELIKDNVAAAPKFNFIKELLAIGVSKETLDDWLIVRKKKKAANTKTAFNGLINQINKSGLLPENAIKLAAEKSWSGFNASWIDSDDKKGFSKNTQANINTMSDMDLD